MKINKGAFVMAKVFAVLLCFIILLCGTIIPTYLIAKKSVEKNLSGEISSYFLQGLNNFQLSLNEIDRYCYALRNEYNVIAVSIKDDDTLSSPKNRSLYNLLRATRITHNINSQTTLMIFSKNNIFYQDAFVYNDGSEVFGGRKIKLDDLSYADFRDILINKDEKWLHIDNACVDAIDYENCFLYINRYGVNGGNGVVIATLLQGEKLLDSFILPQIDQYLVAIECKNGGILYSTFPETFIFKDETDSDKMQIDGDTYEVWNGDIAQYGIRITMAIPMDVFDLYIQPLTRVMRLLFICALSLVAISCVYLIWYVFRPLVPLFGILQNETGFKHEGRNLFERITYMYQKQSQIMNENEVKNNMVLKQLTGSALCHAIRGEKLGEGEKRLLSELPALSAEYTVAVYRLARISDNIVQNLQIYGVACFANAWNESTIYDKGDFVSILPAELFSNADSQNVRRLLRSMCCEEVETGWSSSHMGIDGLRDAYCEACGYIEKEYRNISIEDDKRPTQLCNENDISIYDGSIDEIIGYIDNHLDETDMSLTFLKEKFNLSTNYISMLIKNKTGATYSNYITDKRMNLAMHLLKNTNLTVEEICKKTGYTNRNTFYKAFKRTYSNTPNYYKKDI